jgi:hypothetical protein
MRGTPRIGAFDGNDPNCDGRLISISADPMAAEQHLQLNRKWDCVDGPRSSEWGA